MIKSCKAVVSLMDYFLAQGVLKGRVRIGEEVVGECGFCVSDFKSGR